MELGPAAIPALTELLLDKRTTFEAREFAALRLGDLRAATSIPSLLRAFEGEDEQGRRIARSSIAVIGMDSGLPALIRHLKDTNAYVRANSALAIGRFGHKAREAIPALLQAVEDSDGDVHAAVVFALNECEPDVTLSLVRNLRYDIPSRRLGAVWSLGRLAQKPDLAIPALIESLSDTNPAVRESSAEALGRFGARAKPAIPELARVQQDENTKVRNAATNALTQIRSDQSGIPIAK